jgi:transglutaminase-like putative cysteine protease
MRISVLHSTVYRYTTPVYLEPHTLRFRPRQDGTQRLLSYQLQIGPQPAGLAECLDQDGNAVVQAWFDVPVGELAVRSAFQIETLRENPFDFLLCAADRQLPPILPEAQRAALAPYVDAASIAPEVRDFAGAIAAGASGKTLPFLLQLNRALFETTNHVIRRDGSPNAPQVTLGERTGSCRDLAVLFCAACRAVGIPARFVSGYECQAATEENGDLHAWAEVYLHCGGWRSFDPSRGLAVSTSHIAVAAAADPSLAAPVSGTYRGVARSDMEFMVSLSIS